jgi:endoglucanase
MKWRDLLKTSAGATALSAAGPTLPLLVARTQTPSAAKLPRRRGFNLLEKFSHRKPGNPSYQARDFALMSAWGFDFARLPMSYLCWTELKHIDAAKAFLLQHV